MLPSRRQYKPKDVLAIRPLNWDEMINNNDDDENSTNPRLPSVGRTHLGDGNDNDDGEGEEDTQGGEKGLGKGWERRMGRWKGRQLRTEKAKAKG